MPENASTEIRAVLLDGRMYERKPDGTLVPLDDRSDWARVDAMTDEELTIVHPPQKVPVGLKLDTDVLAWFKSHGRGYQTRINAVLRRYMEAQRRPRS
jgi:uncharacterized protein (DUF4415 family)